MAINSSPDQMQMICDWGLRLGMPWCARGVQDSVRSNRWPARIIPAPVIPARSTRPGQPGPVNPARSFRHGLHRIAGRVILDDAYLLLGHDFVTDAERAELGLIRITGGHEHIVCPRLARIRDVSAGRICLGRRV